MNKHTMKDIRKEYKEDRILLANGIGMPSTQLKHRGILIKKHDQLVKELNAWRKETQRLNDIINTADKAVLEWDKYGYMTDPVSGKTSWHAIATLRKILEEDWTLSKLLDKQGIELS